MKSFLEGRAVVGKADAATTRHAPTVNHALPTFAQPVQEPEGATERGKTPPPPPSTRHGEVKIEAIEDQGIVRTIVVICSCGERIEVHCGY